MRVYTYIYCISPEKMICLLDQGVEWQGKYNKSHLYTGIATTDKHPNTWNDAYRLVTFTEFSQITGATMDHILRG